MFYDYVLVYYFFDVVVGLVFLFVGFSFYVVVGAFSFLDVFSSGDMFFLTWVRTGMLRGLLNKPFLVPSFDLIWMEVLGSRKGYELLLMMGGVFGHVFLYSLAFRMLVFMFIL